MLLPPFEVKEGEGGVGGGWMGGEVGDDVDEKGEGGALWAGRGGWLI